MEDAVETWAVEEFGQAYLGDRRLTARAVGMAAELARHPAGRITRAFGSAAEREAAYRFVENRRFGAAALSTAMANATASRASQYPHVLVPIDGVAFTVAHEGPGFGPVSNKHHGNGAHAMSALALDPHGVPLGVLGQVFWTRTTKTSPAYRVDRRPLDQRESGHWLTVISQALGSLRTHAPATRPWFQLDRGGDCAEVLLHTIDCGADLTVRACYDRVVQGGKLWTKAATGRYLGSYRLAISRPGRASRVATISVRARAVSLVLRIGTPARHPTRTVQMWVVEARERGGHRSDRVLWRLLTTKPITTFAQARTVITAYSRRWRIEEFHLSWKSGACGIEQSWLRHRDHFFKWATLTGAVAARLERIKHLSRTEPQRSALDEFTRDEIDAAIALRDPRGVSIGASPTIGEVTRWIADIGGYTGKSSGGPPGIRVLARGFIEVEAAARAIARMRKDPTSRG